jgi:hypothetical protein
MKYRLMQVSASLGCLILSCASLALGQSPTSKIKLKNGDVIQGKIRGRLAAEVKAVNYSILNGKDIDRIDEKGISTREGAKIIDAFTPASASPPSTMEVLEAMVKAPAPGFALVDLKQGARVSIIAFTEDAKKTIRGVVLGEIRADPKTKGWELIPALEIVTSNGTVTISVDKIVSLEQEPQKSNQEKKN